MFKRNLMLAIAIAASALLASAPVMATDYSAGVRAGLGVGGSVYSGSVAGNASSVSSGGSQAVTGAQGNGFAVAGTINAGGGHADSSGYVSGNGVSTNTNVSSYSAGASGSLYGGNGTANTGGGVGTDTNAAAWGGFTRQSAGFSIGGYAGFSGYAGH